MIAGSKRAYVQSSILKTRFVGSCRSGHLCLPVGGCLHSIPIPHAPPWQNLMSFESILVHIILRDERIQPVLANKATTNAAANASTERPWTPNQRICTRWYDFETLAVATSTHQTNEFLHRRRGCSKRKRVRTQVTNPWTHRHVVYEYVLLGRPIE